MSRYRMTMAEALQKVHNETPQGYALVQKAKEIAKKMAGSYSNAVKEIEKLQKGLSDNSSVKDALLKANEQVELDEGRMKTIYTMQQDGKSTAEIAKYMKLPIKTIKDILGEGEEIEESLNEFSDAMLNKLAREYEPLRGKTMSVQQANKLRQIFNMVPDRALDALRKKKIPFLSGLALSRMVQKGMPVREQVEDEKEKKESDNKDSVIASLKDQISMLKQKLENEKNKAVKPEPNPETGEVPLTIGLANKLLKDKEMKKEDVKEAFAVQITKKDGGKLVHGKYKSKADADKFIKWYKTGDMKDTKSIEVIKEADLSKPQIKKVHKMADELPKKDFKDRYGKEKGDAVRYATATNIVKKKLGIEENQADMMFKKLSQRAQTYVNELLRSGMGTMEAIAKAKEKFNEGDMKNEEMRLRVESMAALKKKADKSGMPYSILKKVFDRGMAAWKGGHRPGASQHQWAYARVNSFVTKSSGTWGGADKDLAKQVRGSK